MSMKHKDSTIYIKDSIDEWEQLRTEIGCNDATLAKLLLKCYSRYGGLMQNELEDLKQQDTKCEIIKIKCKKPKTKKQLPSSTKAPTDKEKVTVKTEADLETTEIISKKVSIKESIYKPELDSWDKYMLEKFQEIETSSCSSEYESDEDLEDIKSFAEQKVEMIALPCTNDETSGKRLSARLKSKGYRPNYASVAKWDSGDLGSELTGENVDRNEDNLESCTDGGIDSKDEVDESSKSENKSKLKKRKLDEDPDFEINDLDDETEIKSESDSESIGEDSDFDINGTKPERKSSRRPWKSIKLDNYPHKYKMETDGSYERKNRGSNIEETLYSCLVCGKFKSVDRDTFEKHIESHVNRVLECCHCDFIGGTEAQLSIHRLKFGHNKKKQRKELVCDICGIVWYSLGDWKKHMGKVHDKPQFECNFCELKFTTYTAKQLHVRNEHLTQYCSVCTTDFSSSTPEEFEIHKSTCKPGSGFPCQVCGKVLVSKSGLSSHIRLAHNNVRTYQCHLCPYTAKCSGNLREHVYTHTGVHPYSCDQCSFTCVQSYQLTSHQRTHTGEKPYKCTQCNYAAAWNVQLKDHVKVHSMNTSVLCEPCNILFKNDKSKKVHEKKDH